MPTPPKAWVQMGYLKIDEYFEKTQEELGAYLKMPLPTEDLATEAPVYNTEGDLRVLVLDPISNTKKFSVPLCKFVNKNWTKEQIDNWQHGTLYLPVSNPHITEESRLSWGIVIDESRLSWGVMVDETIHKPLWEKAHIVILGNRMLKCAPPI